jgi:hypothetical protein
VFLQDDNVASRFGRSINLCERGHCKSVRWRKVWNETWPSFIRLVSQTVALSSNTHDVTGRARKYSQLPCDGYPIDWQQEQIEGDQPQMDLNITATGSIRNRNVESWASNSSHRDECHRRWHGAFASAFTLAKVRVTCLNRSLILPHFHQR